MIYFLVFFSIIVGVILMTGVLISAPGYKGPASDHFDGNRFLNYGNVEARGFFSVLKWMLTRKRQKWVRNTSPATGPAPASSVTFGATLTFVNHSSFLLQTAGYNFLIDPVFSKRVSPFTFAGPSRMRQPGIRPDDLPQINYVLLTHNHYDHLDIATVLELHRRFRPAFVVPLGVGAYLIRNGIEDVVEMDWWQSVGLRDELVLRAAPAQHFSGRGITDRNKTLWCGYVVETRAHRIYFAGDTAYNKILFGRISEQFGSPDLSVLPIGAYQPRWFMSPIHCSPAEAVQIHLDLKSRRSLACHFGTFPLGDDSRDEPLHDLRAALSNKNLSPADFTVLSEGESLKLE